MAQGKHKESPAEPFKRALGMCVRAVAGDGEVPVIRGSADSLALTAACHDVKLHARLAPKAGPARAVFETVERARIEALGANRMPGMASNLTARVEDQYG